MGSGTGNARMKHAVVRIVAITLWMLSTAMVGVIILLPLIQRGLSFQANDPLIGIGMLGTATVGTLVVVRKPRQPLGWLLLVIGFSAILSGFALSYLDWAAGLAPQRTPGAGLMAWLVQWTWMLALSLLVSFLLLLYPTGTLPSPRWRPIGWLSGLWVAASVISSAVGPGDASIPNPLSVPALQIIPLDMLIAGALPIMAAGTAALVVRYRRGSPVERQQIKWLFYPSTLLVAGILVQLAASAAGLDETVVYSKITDIYFGTIYLLFPALIGLAILRHRLWDIDVIIRRTLQYSLLTGLLALIYFGGVALLQGLLSRLTGQAQSPLVVVGSTLLIAALFNPLRLRIRAFIDRRFYRARYDAERTLARFAATARDEVDIERLTDALLGAVEDTMQPRQIALWLSREQQ